MTQIGRRHFPVQFFKEYIQFSDLPSTILNKTEFTYHFWVGWLGKQTDDDASNGRDDEYK